jgi:hypothetical protein
MSFNSAPLRNGSPTQEFREWGYMAQFYQEHMDVLVNAVDSRYSNQLLLTTMRQLGKKFFSNPIHFTLAAEDLAGCEQFGCFFERLFSCIQGRSREDYLNTEVYRDTPNPERMAYKNFQRKQLLERARVVFENAQLLLESRNTWSDEEFTFFYQDLQSQALAKEARDKIVMEAARKKEQLHQQKQELLQQCLFDGMNYTLVQGTPFDMDFDLALQAVTQNGLAYQFIHPRLLEEDVELALTKAAIKENSLVFSFLPPHMQSDTRFSITAFSLNFEVWRYINPALKKSSFFFEETLKSLHRDHLDRQDILEPRELFRSLGALHKLVMWSEIFFGEPESMKVCLALDRLVSSTAIALLNQKPIRDDMLTFVTDTFSKFMIVFENQPEKFKVLLLNAPILIAEYEALFDLSSMEKKALIEKQPKILKFFNPHEGNKDLILNQVGSILHTFCSPFSSRFALLHGQQKLLELLDCMQKEFYQDKDFCLKILDVMEESVFDIYYHASISEVEFLAFVAELVKVQALLPLQSFSSETNGEIVKNYSFLTYSLPGHLRSDPAWIQQRALHNQRIFLFAEQNVRSDPHLILHLLQKNINVLRFATDSIKNNRDFFLHAAQFDYKALKYASMQLRADPAFVMDVIKVNPFAFKGAASELRHNKAFVTRAYQLDSRALFGASSKLKKIFTGAGFIETVTYERVVETEFLQKRTLK